MNLSLTDLIDLCYTKAKYYQQQAITHGSAEYFSDSKTFRLMATHLTEVLREQLATTKHPTTTMDRKHN